MVYINSSGKVENGNKISWRRPVESAKEIFGIFVLFFFSLISPLTQIVSPNSGNSSSSGSGSNFRSSGGSNDSNRRGGFRTMSDIRPPPFIGGGCSGGMCG